jgi:hypothetical protein
MAFRDGGYVCSAVMLAREMQEGTCLLRCEECVELADVLFKRHELTQGGIAEPGVSTLVDTARWGAEMRGKAYRTVRKRAVGPLGGILGSASQECNCSRLPTVSRRAMRRPEE